MQQVLITLLLIVFGLYLLLILYYRLSWSGIPDYQLPSPDIKPVTTITVIVPARNEEDNIAACLTALCKQTYPAALFDILVVDDHSTDNTVTIIKSFESAQVKLIHLKELLGEKINSYKKKAIEMAIAQSTGSLIVTTDADCTMPENWLYTLACFYEQNQPEFIAAPVAIQTGSAGKSLQTRFIEIFQALDLMTLQGITGASVHQKIHSMCNGANLAYTKKVFDAVGGFAGIDHVASGDDMLLMHKIYKLHPDKLMFLKSKEVIVQTAPVNTIRDFFNQRIRWASKADQYDDKRIFWVLLWVYLVNVLLLVIPVIAIGYGSTLVLGPLTLAGLWFLLLGLKTITELIFLYPVATFFGRRKLLWFFPLMQPFHILYTVIAGWLGKFGRYSWKERNVK